MEVNIYSIYYVEKTDARFKITPQFYKQRSIIIDKNWWMLKVVVMIGDRHFQSGWVDGLTQSGRLIDSFNMWKLKYDLITKKRRLRLCLKTTNVSHT